jgi:hypothetical protein
MFYFYGIHATGKIKQLSLIGGTILLLSLPITYVLLKNGTNPLTAYYVNIGISIGWCVNNLLISKKLMNGFSIRDYVNKIVFKSLLVLFFPLLISILLKYFFLSIPSNINSILIISTCFICMLISIFFLGLNKEEKKILRAKLANITE